MLYISAHNHIYCNLHWTVQQMVLSRQKSNLTPVNSNLIKTVTLPSTLYSILQPPLVSAFTTQYEVPARWPSPIPDTITPFNPAHHWSHLQNYGEPFRADSINKWALGGAPFSDSSGKIKDKWRIIDSQLSAKGISMTELLGFLPLSLSQSLSSHSLHICLPVWSVQLLVAPPAPPGIKPSINTQQKGENLLKTSITAIRIRREASDLILYGNPWVCPETELCLLILPTLQHTLQEAMQDFKKVTAGTNKYISVQSSFSYIHCYAEHGASFVCLKKLIIFKCLWNPTISQVSQISDLSVICCICSVKLRSFSSCRAETASVIWSISRSMWTFANPGESSVFFSQRHGGAC